MYPSQIPPWNASSPLPIILSKAMQTSESSLIWGPRYRWFCLPWASLCLLNAAGISPCSVISWEAYFFPVCLCLLSRTECWHLPGIPPHSSSGQVHVQGRQATPYSRRSAVGQSSGTPKGTPSLAFLPAFALWFPGHFCNLTRRCVVSGLKSCKP